MKRLFVLSFAFIFVPCLAFGSSLKVESQSAGVAFNVKDVTSNRAHYFDIEDSNNDNTVLKDIEGNEDGAIQQLSYTNTTVKVGDKAGTVPGNADNGVNFNSNGTLSNNVHSNQMSMTFWLLLPDNNYTSTEAIFSTYTNLEGIRYDVESDESIRFREWGAGGSNEYDISTSALSTNTWYHLAITRDASNGSGDDVKVYLDGSQIGSTDLGSSFTPSEAEYPRIGGEAADFFHGFVDDFRIYSDILTADEVDRIYKSTD